MTKQHKNKTSTFLLVDMTMFNEFQPTILEQRAFGSPPGETPQRFSHMAGIRTCDAPET